MCDVVVATLTMDVWWSMVCPWSTFSAGVLHGIDVGQKRLVPGEAVESSVR